MKLQRRTVIHSILGGTFSRIRKASWRNQRLFRWRPIWIWRGCKSEQLRRHWINVWSSQLSNSLFDPSDSSQPTSLNLCIRKLLNLHHFPWTPPVPVWSVPSDPGNLGNISLSILSVQTARSTSFAIYNRPSVLFKNSKFWWEGARFYSLYWSKFKFCSKSSLSCNSTLLYTFAYHINPQELLIAPGCTTIRKRCYFLI